MISGQKVNVGTYIYIYIYICSYIYKVISGQKVNVGTYIYIYITLCGLQGGSNPIRNKLTFAYPAHPYSPYLMIVIIYISGLPSNVRELTIRFTHPLVLFNHDISAMDHPYYKIAKPKRLPA